MSLPRPRLLARPEVLVCILAFLASLWLHLVFLTQAGGLWRDEICGIATARMPAFGDLWRFLTLDSAGLVSPLLLRGWAALGLGHGDAGWRLYGFLIGLALLAAFWLNARMLGRKWPLISLALLAASPVLIRWGDSVRAYGLGCLLMLLTLGLVWRLSRQPSRARFALATLAAVLSVHTLYGNAFLLLAVGLGASLVCLRRRQWKAVAAVLSVGLVAALSLLPYLPGIRASSHNWWIIQKSGFVPDWVWFNILNSAGSPHLWLAVVWFILLPVAAAAGLWSGWRGAGPEADLHLFAALTMLLATGLFMLFIWLSALLTHVWYFLPLLVLLAACANALLPEALAVSLTPAPLTLHVSPPHAHVSRFTFHVSRVATIAFAALMVLVSLPRAAQDLRTRQTNIDQLAAYLAANADPADLIFVHPWYCGVTFQRYYHGRAPWLTVPPLEDHRIQRFDLLKEQMLRGDPMPPVIERCTHVLASGHRLWLVGLFQYNGAKPPDLPKPHNGPQGWAEDVYEAGWAAQISYLVVNHAGELAPVPEQSLQPISPYEDLPLYYARGWHTNSSPTP
jgi:hypothetical protein